MSDSSVNDDRVGAVIELLPDAAVVHAAGRILFANRAAAALFGADAPATLIGRPVHDFVHPDFTEAVSRRIRRVAEAGAVAELEEETLLRLDGEPIDAEVTAMTIPYGGHPAILAIIRDVTHRKRAEQELRESEERFRRLTETIPEIFWMIEPERPEPWYVSPAGERIYGISSAEFRRNPQITLECIHADDQPRVLPVMLASPSVPYDLEYRIVRPDGQIRFVRSRSFPTLGEDGEVVRITGFTEDITARKEAEAAALEAGRLKTAFLANMSHEIRTPLNVILGLTSFVAEHLAARGDSSQDASFEGIVRAGRRLLATIQGILDLSKIETGTFELRPDLIDLRSLIEHHLAEYSPFAKSKGIALRCDIRLDDTRVYGDEYSLSQAIANLLDNAVKFTEFGHVTLRLLRGADARLWLEVEDTGVGIEAAFLRRLCEPFSQEDAGYARRFEGSGLGLALVKRYVEMNGAALEIESRKGQGSVFRVRFAPAGAGDVAA